MNNLVNDLVSVVTPCRNCAAFIAQTIESVLAQSYPHWEMIIVDDDSADASCEIIRSYSATDARIGLIQFTKNNGVSAARNAAIKIAKGRYIAFLDSDDLWLPEKLVRQLAFMRDNDLAFTYASYQLIDANNNRLGELIAAPTITYQRLLKTCDVGCLTAIYDTEKLHKMYMPDVFQKGDYALWLQVLKKIPMAKGIQQPLARYRIRKHSLSANKFQGAAAQWRVYRRVEHLSLPKSVYYFAHYVGNGLVKLWGRLLKHGFIAH